MNRGKTIIAVAGGIAVLAACWVLAPWSVQARPPFDDKTLKDMQQELLEVVKKGDALWHSGKLGTNGHACAGCHPDGANSNANTFPKFQSNIGKVATLREMINWCIKNPLEGKELPEHSEEMKALEAYAIYMHRGLALQPGENKKAVPGVPVKGGPGY
jgi:thiosulfate dehydrogenase